RGPARSGVRRSAQRRGPGARRVLGTQRAPARCGRCRAADRGGGHRWRGDGRRSRGLPAPAARPDPRRGARRDSRRLRLRAARRRAGASERLTSLPAGNALRALCRVAWAGGDRDDLFAWLRLAGSTWDASRAHDSEARLRVRSITEAGAAERELLAAEPPRVVPELTAL